MGKLLSGLGSNLIGIATSLAIIGGGIYYSLTKEDNIGEAFKRPSHSIELLNQIYHVPLRSEFKKKFLENLKLTVEIDKEKDILYFGNYTQNYNRKDWGKENIPVHKKHTSINHVYSKTFILHPPEVKISKQEQKAYLVPAYGWDDNLKPYEKHKEAQMVIEGGEEIMDWTLSKIPIPFFKEFIEQGLKNATKKEKRHYQELFRKIKQGYTATIIPSQIPNKIIGYTETARESKISLETNNLKENAEIYLWAKIALGNPSKAPHGSLPNKYGELENIVVEFRLHSDKTKKIIKQTKSELEKYFFTDKELEIGNIRLSTMDELKGNSAFPTMKKNPHLIIREELIEKELEKLKETPNNKGYLGFGWAFYNFKDRETKWGGWDIIFSFTKFDSLENLKNHISTNRGYEKGLGWTELENPILLSGTTGISPIVNKNLNNKNLTTWIDSLLHYQKRLKTEPLTNNESLKGKKYIQILKNTRKDIIEGKINPYRN